MVRLGKKLIASRAIDNRIGAYVVLEALRLMVERRPELAAEIAAVATTQEEIAYQGGGARTSAYRFDPQVAIVVDVTFATDAPQIEKKQTGDHKLGSGPVLTRGSAVHPLVFQRLSEAADGAGIPYTIQAAARGTSTDADAIHLSRNGVATAVVSVPNRYMHSPNEIVSLDDLDSAARLIAAFCLGLTKESDFAQR
jgi:endoglucanase